MAGQLGGAVEDAYVPLVGQHGQGALHVGMRHRVVVEVEAHIGRLAHGGGHALAQRPVVRGQRQQMVLLGHEGTAHRLAVILWPGPLARRTVAPAPGLGVEVGQIGEAARGEESGAHVTNNPLHATLLVAPPYSHGPRFEAVVRRQGQQRRV